MMTVKHRPVTFVDTLNRMTRENKGEIEHQCNTGEIWVKGHMTNRRVKWKVDPSKYSGVKGVWVKGHCRKVKHE